MWQRLKAGAPGCQRLKAGAPSKIRGGLVCLCLRPPWGFPRPAWRSVFCRGDLPFNPLSKTLSPHYVESFQCGILTTSAINFLHQPLFKVYYDMFTFTPVEGGEGKARVCQGDFCCLAQWQQVRSRNIFFKLSKYIFDPLATCRRTALTYSPLALSTESTWWMGACEACGGCRCAPSSSSSLNDDEDDDYAGDHQISWNAEFAQFPMRGVHTIPGATRPLQQAATRTKVGTWTSSPAPPPPSPTSPSQPHLQRAQKSFLRFFDKFTK